MEVLDDHHLDSLQCSICHKYLSIFPVKNHSSRDVTCGRCSRDDDDGVRSLYELVAKRYLFKCINRYEGCKKLLRVDEVEAHEKNCIGNFFNCPKCEGEPAKSILELIWHYKRQHPTSVLQKNSFEGKLPVKDVMLYIQDEVVSFILIQYELSSNTLYLSAAILTAAEGTQTFLVSEGSVFTSTEKKECKPLNESYSDCFKLHLNSLEYVRIFFILELSKIVPSQVFQLGNSRDIGVENTENFVANNEPKSECDKPKEEAIETTLNEQPQLLLTEKSRCLQKPRLSQRFKTLHSKYKLSESQSVILSKDGKKQFDLTCSNCKEIISKYIYVCWEMDHYLCKECRIWCGICECPIEYMCKTEPIYQMIDMIEFPCKFNCGQFFFNRDLHPHEYNCKMNVIKCPKCLLNYQFSSIYSHLITDHEVGFSLFFNFSNLRESIKRNNTAHYFLLHRLWFCVKWDEVDKYNSTYNLTFEPLNDIENAKFGLVVNKKNYVYTSHYDNVKINNKRFSLEPFLNFN